MTRHRNVDASCREVIYDNWAATLSERIRGTAQHHAAIVYNRLTFAKGQFPPVNAFGSVTTYDGKTQLLIENPINRYLINSPTLPNLKKNPDGSLTLLLRTRSAHVACGPFQRYDCPN